MTQPTSKNGRTVREIIASSFCVGVDELKSETHIERDLNADSLDNVELCMKMEVEFDIAIPDEEWANCDTVYDIETLVNSKVYVSGE